MLRRINDGFVNQHDRDSVTHRVDAAALGALQTLPLVFQGERFFADGTNQDVEQVLRNHGGILRFLSGGTRLRGSRLWFRDWTGPQFLVVSSRFSVGPNSNDER